MRDVATEIGRDKVAQVVARFYAAIRVHPTLSEPFARVHDWPAHEAVLTHFWWVTLGGERYLDYRYRVAERHMASGFTPALLDQWLTLFAATIQVALPDDLAEAWLARARNIGQSLRLMHEFSQSEALADHQEVTTPAHHP
ncbi:MAG: group III truncated hemoglobin [Moraxellaceae bacterium]|nr:group III truncated hemoglobin [Moraxellaceae bacterium]